MSEPQLKIELYHPKFHKEVLQYGLDIAYTPNFFAASWNNFNSLIIRAVICSIVFALSGCSPWTFFASLAIYEAFLRFYVYYTWPEAYAR